MSVFPPDFLEITQVSANLLILLTFPALVVAYYWWLPKVGAKIGNQLARNFLGGLFQLLQSQKMRTLGEKGVAAREFDALLKAPTGEDPVKEILAPIASQMVQERWGKKAAGAVEMGLSALPVNLTDIMLPKIAEFVDAKWPQLKLSEQLHALKAIVPKEGERKF